METNRKKLNWKPLIIILIICGIVAASFLIAYIGSKEAYVSENTSNTGVVVEKYYTTSKWKNFFGDSDTRFFVIIERSTVKYNGEPSTLREKHILSCENWTDIEVGDVVTYNEKGSMAFEHADAIQK